MNTLTTLTRTTDAPVLLADLDPEQPASLAYLAGMAAALEVTRYNAMLDTPAFRAY